MFEVVDCEDLLILREGQEGLSLLGKCFFMGLSNSDVRALAGRGNEDILIV